VVGVNCAAGIPCFTPALKNQPITRHNQRSKFRNPRLERVPRELMFRRVNDICKRQRVCPHCGQFNGVVK